MPWTVCNLYNQLGTEKKVRLHRPWSNPQPTNTAASAFHFIPGHALNYSNGSMLDTLLARDTAQS